MKKWHIAGEYTAEPEFLNLLGAQESIPRNQFRQAVYILAGRYDNPIPARFLAPAYIV